MSTPKVKEQETLFRASLEDVITFLEKIGPSCSSLDEIISVARLGLKNDGQLRILMQTVTYVHENP